MQIKRLSDNIHQAVLGYSASHRTALKNKEIYGTLEGFGLHKATDANQVVNLPIPAGFKTLKEEIGDAIGCLTQATLDSLAAVLTWEFPAMPSNFNGVTGWQAWNMRSQKWQPIPQPPSAKVFFMDFETVETVNGWYPTCAVAMSDRGWLLWLTDFNRMSSVVPFGTENLMINYNTSYDRAYLASEYLIKDSGNRFFDLMSAWIVCRGLSNQQRPLYLSKDLDLDWKDETSLNGLSSVYEHYYGSRLDKGVRDNIVSEGLPWVSQNMSSVIRYCAEDVLHTAELFKRLYPEYLLHRPSPISQSGSILLGSCWLPLDPQRFPKYYDKAEGIYQDIIARTNTELMKEAKAYLDKILEDHPIPEILKSSKKADKEHHAAAYASWVARMPKQAQCLDWTISTAGKSKGLPMWFRKAQKEHQEGSLTLSKRFVPIVLGITWKSEPILWGDVPVGGHMAMGWYTEAYGSLPHPEERGKNVTSVFAKGFVTAFEEGILDTSRDDTKELLAAKMSTVNWVSLRSRVAAIKTEDPEGFPVVIPQLVVNGTITGRCTDRLWMVASNPKKSRIGTELKSMITPPKGYCFVGADADSQELWLASVMGDSRAGICGSTPLGFIVSAGAKGKTLETSTDMHSIMALETGISRDNTKARIYGATYGQGVTGDTNGLLKAIPTMTLEEAQANSKLFMQKFKGVLHQTSDGHRVYKCGLASEAFNRMEKIADSKIPRTPLTGAVMSKALSGLNDFKPTRTNWVVQSSGVDFRDLWVLLTNQFFKKLDVSGRVMIMIHDEIRTMVRVEDAYKAAYAIQLAHLYTRAAFIDALGLDCIPAGVAWCSGVDIDHYCLRKDPSDPQITPSQPEGLPLGLVVTPSDLMDALKTPEYSIVP
jgi:DNA polymerase gamma 1